MPYAKPHRRKKFSYKLVLVLACALAASAIFFAWFKLGHGSGNTSTIDIKPTAIPTATETINLSPASSGDNTTSQTSKENAQNGQTNTVTKIQEPTITITRSAQQGSNIEISTIITNLNSGQCKLIVYADSATSQVYNAEAGIQQQNGFSVCQGFTIPVSQIPSSGTWNFQISLSDTSVSTNVKVEVSK